MAKISTNLEGVLLDRAAMTTYCTYNNFGRPKFEFDFHGFNLKESEKAMNEILTWGICHRKALQCLLLITGKSTTHSNWKNGDGPKTILTELWRVAINRLRVMRVEGCVLPAIQRVFDDPEGNQGMICVEL